MVDSLTERVIHCTDLAGEPGFPGCCDSCHDDWESGYGEPFEHYDGDRLTHSVCCKVTQWLDGTTKAKS
jgi:hypothetical protein